MQAEEDAGVCWSQWRYTSAHTSVFMTPFESNDYCECGGLYPSRAHFLLRSSGRRHLLRDGWLRHEQRSKGFLSAMIRSFPRYPWCLHSLSCIDSIIYGHIILYIHLAMYNFTMNTPTFPWPLSPWALNSQLDICISGSIYSPILQPAHRWRQHQAHILGGNNTFIMLRLYTFPRQRRRAGQWWVIKW